FSPDTLAEEARGIEQAGVPAIILFGIPEIKDELGSEAWADDGIICKSVESVKRACPNLCVITDVCMCEYADHGHCGVVKTRRDGILDVDNDATIDLLARQAIAHAHAGADMVAPSDMMDGRVGAIRKALDEAGMPDVPIMAYSAKFASAFYGPFRDAAESPPQFGDRSSYQMDPANAREAMREIQLDIEEGADIVMVKPALPYLDIIRMARDRFEAPLAAYNVSGEYAMLKSAADNGWIDEKRAVMESLLSIRRAGADLILTYWAKQAAKWLQE
ncbi:MAG: porphobilinogen synthase, partial [Candidatus Hydrogenedentes bacterium]|nr:porphobilinogen synthase [Candidatus Hydrogenedentota bacterium]